MPYIHYIFENLEPLRIADSKSSQNGQTSTIRFIPGSTIRGMVINTLIRREGFNLEKYKERLFSEETLFLNAYPVSEDNLRFFPSPKGFYEDKTDPKGKKKIENVVISGEYTPGYKRASLGQFARINGDTLEYCFLKSGADLKIKRNVSEGEKIGLFRNEYVQSGYRFAGEVYIEDAELVSMIKSIFDVDSSFILGNARTAGLGKCVIRNCAVNDEIPFAEYCDSRDRKDFCYMILLSDTAMRDGITGEYSGIDEKKLADILGVKNLDVEYCATSINNVYGFNRTLGGYIPTINMYEKGSVFKLVFKGETISGDSIKKIMNTGIGVRKNEGFGRILIPNNYEKICNKFPIDICRVKTETHVEEEDEETLRVVARNYYRQVFDRSTFRFYNQNPIKKGNASLSRIGNVESLITTFRYDYKEAHKALTEYFNHSIEKEDKQKTQNGKQDSKALHESVMKILDMQEDEFEKMLEFPFAGKELIMGINKHEIVSQEMLGQMKLELLLGMIRFDNRKR